MSLDITSETVTLQNGMITLHGTGNPGDTIDIYVNGQGPKATAVVDANGNWTAGPFNPGVPPGQISIKVVVRHDPTQQHVETITVNPSIIPMLNAEAERAAVGGENTRRAKPIYAITIHRGTPPEPEKAAAKKPKPKKPAAKKPAAKKPAAKPAAKAKPKPKK